MLVWVALRRTADLKFQIRNSQFAIRNSCGGEGGIRTHGTVPRSQHFQCCQFNHSCTSPEPRQKVKVKRQKLPVRFCPFTFLPFPWQDWRRGWDSNPRWALTHSGFRDRCTNPLCDLSTSSTDFSL